MCIPRAVLLSTLLFACFAGIATEGINGQESDWQTCAAAGTCAPPDSLDDDDSDNSFFLQSDVSTADCPTSTEAEEFWEDYFKTNCNAEYGDLPKDVKEEIGSGYFQLKSGSKGCQYFAHLELGTLSYEASPVGPTSDMKWGGDDASAVLRRKVDGKDTSLPVCEIIDKTGTPTIVSISSDAVDEIVGQIQTIYALECKTTKDAIMLAMDLSETSLEGKRGDDLPDGSSEISTTITLSNAAGDPTNFDVYFTEAGLSDEDKLMKKTDDFEEGIQEEALKNDMKNGLDLIETEDTASYIQRNMKIENQPSANAAEAATVSRRKDEVLGKVKVLQAQITPRPCSLCGECDAKVLAELLQDDDEEGKLQEQKRRYPELQPGVFLRVDTPAAGHSDNLKPPVSPGSVNTLGTFNVVSEPEYGDNFHSSVMPKRTEEDHKRVWAQSRALIETVKAERNGEDLPDSYHFYDSVETAKCFQPAYSQGKCGSCWAFASLGALEKQICLRARGSVVASLSREMLVRCSEQNFACSGGNADKAYEDLMEIGGVFSTDCLPYQGKGSKHCPVFAYSWFGQGSAGKTGKFARIDQEIQQSCDDHTRYSNRPPLGQEWDMPFRMMYEARFGSLPNMANEKLQRFRRNFARVKARDRVPSWWLYGETAMKAAVVKYGSVYASFKVRDDFKKRQCGDGCWPPGTVYGEEALFKPATCGCGKGHAVHIIGFGEDILETGLKVPYWLIENSWGAEEHGDIFGEDIHGAKGFGKDPFTENHPMELEDKCILAGYAWASQPMMGGCGGNQKRNARDDVEETGGDPDGMWFSFYLNGNHTGDFRVPGGSKPFSYVVPYMPGPQNFTFRIYAGNHTKQGGFDMESYGITHTTLRCRGRGFRYSFTQNDTKAKLSWGRKTRQELKAEADALIPTQQDDEYLYGGCPKACRTGRYSWAKPCLGILARWGSCYTDDWARRSSWIQSRKIADCEPCEQNAFKVKQKAIAAQNLDNATYLKWFMLVEQSWDAPGTPGWMRMNVGNCKIETEGWVKNAQLSATYEVTMPDNVTTCDERHSAPYAKGKFVSAPGFMPDQGKTSQRCPPPLLGNVTLYCDSGTLIALENTCRLRPGAHASMPTSAGYYKTVRGVNYHGIEDGAAFAVAEMNRFASHCPTLSWSIWSACNTTTPCERGVQSRTREPIGISKDDPQCAEMMFYEERPCVGPGFCSQVLTRFIKSGSAEIASFLASYKKQSTTISSDKYATAGAHMLPTATPTCTDAKYWCKITTGAESCDMYMEGHFEVKKDATYAMEYNPDSGSGIIEFNTMGEGNEQKLQYQVRAQGGMFEWQDLGFHHRRRRTDSKPWVRMSSVELSKGTYFARMTRTGWSSCPDFSLRLTQTSSVYTTPLLLGAAAAEVRGVHGGSKQKTTTWSNTWGAISSWESRARNSRYRGYASKTETGTLHELVLRNSEGGTVLKKVPITSLNFTADELYDLAGLDKFDIKARSRRRYEMVLRATVVVPEPGEYEFKYQTDTSYTQKPWQDKNSRRRQTKFVMRAGEKNPVFFDAWQGSATKFCSYTADTAGEIKFEISQILSSTAPGGKMAMPNFATVEVKKKDMLHGEQLQIGSKTKYMSDLRAIRGDTEARIDWPDRDDPLSSELKTQTFQPLMPQALLIGHTDIHGFAAVAETKIDAGACVALEAWAKDTTGDFLGVGMNLCDVDGSNQYLELVTYHPPTSLMHNYSTKQIGWVHAMFTHPLHMQIVRDPLDLETFMISYKPDDRLEFATPFGQKLKTGYTGKVDIGVSMNSPEAYRYAEFYNISIEECPSSCFDASQKQLYCGETTTACGNKLTCAATCSAESSDNGTMCKDNQCMVCDAIPPSPPSWDCGMVKHMCTNIKGQKVQTWQSVSNVSKPTPAHFCADHKWTCIPKTKWAFLADGLECGSVHDETTCGDEVELFPCPRENDVCESHKCKCYPNTFPAEHNCGAAADGCGREVHFGDNNGTCPKVGDRCNNNVCCSPKDKSDFPSTHECGSEPDGCGGGVAFRKAAAGRAFFTKEPETTTVNYVVGQVGFEFQPSYDAEIGSLARGLMDGKSKLEETSKVSLWDTSSKNMLASVDIGPDAVVSDGYAWVTLSPGVNVSKNKRYRLVQTSWSGMKDKWSGKRIYYASQRNERMITDAATLNTMVIFSNSDSEGKYPASSYNRRRVGSGVGIVNMEFVENQGCGQGAWTCEANHTCTKLPISNIFTVKSGPCTVVNGGTCVQSPNYPSRYGNGQTCTIETPGEGTIYSVYFYTESCCDKLTIGSSQYRGYQRMRRTLTKTETMHWRSDSSVNYKGWKICKTSTNLLYQEEEEHQAHLSDSDVKMPNLEELSGEEKAHAVKKYQKMKELGEETDEVIEEEMEEMEDEGEPGDDDSEHP